ncbi:MAG: YwaF family protein [Erysipelotrichaceae bacterium]
MRDFFTYYLDLNNIQHPINIFSNYHLMILAFGFLCVFLLYSRYHKLSIKTQRIFLVVIGFYFIIDEFIYNIWVLSVCKVDPILQILPLHLCTICAYIGALCVYYKKEWLQFFCAIMCSIAGLIAVIYPANIANIYPIFHYRTINFFLLHFSFILFGLIQIRNTAIIKYKHIKPSMALLVVITTLAFIANLNFGTDYMFVQTNSKIAIIKAIHNVVGDYLLLPTAFLIFALILFLSVFMIHQVEKLSKSYQAAKQNKYIA